VRDNVARWADLRRGPCLNPFVRSALPERLPILLTVEETANLLRTSRKGIYAMVERGLVPGVIRIGRRILVRSDELVHWLDQKRAPSPKE
jgi:excisionase family DNA binding protein